MTKKVGKDELKKLVESVLSEGQRLDEFKVTIGSSPSIGKLRHDLGFSGNADKSSWKAAKDAAKALAAAGGNAADVEDADVTAAKANPSSEEFKFADYLAKNSTDADLKKDWSAIIAPPSGGGGGQTISILDASGNLKVALKNPSGTPSKTKIANYLSQHTNASTADKARLVAEVGQIFGGNAGATINKALQKLNATPPPQKGQVVDQLLNNVISALQADVTDLSQPAGELGTPSDAFGDPQAAGKQTQLDTGATTNLDDAATAAAVGMQKITIPMNELLKAQVMRRKTDKNFKVTQNEVQSLEELSLEFEQVTKALSMTPPTKNLLKTLTVDESLMLMTKISYVSSLLGIAKEMPQGQEAGYVWEKMCAILLGGVVGGKKGEAVDVMSALYGGTSSSQKFVAGDVKQANKNIRNIIEAKNKGESVYYLALIKEGAAGGPASGLNKIKFVLAKLEATGPVGDPKFDVSYLKKGGGFQSYAKGEEAPNQKGDYTIISPGNIANLPELDYTIPPNLSLDDAVEQLSTNLQKPGGTFGNLAKATINIAAKLSEMQNVTNEYRNARASTAAGGVSSGNTSRDYADKIADTYASVKTDYKSLFSLLGDYVGTKVTQTFQESKKITAKHLQKLISEKFKK